MALPTEFQPQVLQGLWTKFDTSAPYLMREFFPTAPNLAPGITIQYDVYEYNRGMAPLTPRFAGAPRGVMPVRTRVSFDGYTVKEALEPDLSAMIDGTAPGSLTGSNREAIVANALRQMRIRFDNRAEWIAAQWLTGGALLSSSGVAEVEPSGTIYLDYGSVPNNGPLSVTAGFSSTHVDAGVTASWKTAGTDIFTDLELASAIILRDSGVVAKTVLMNSATYRATFLANTAFKESEFAKAQVFQYGYVKDWRGWEILLYDGEWYPAWETTAETRASGAANTTAHKFIPDDVAIILSRDNVASGRQIVECAPSDADAPAGWRGLYSWEDKEQVHPHGTIYGLEWTGAPVIMNPDSMYIYTKISDTS